MLITISLNNDIGVQMATLADPLGLFCGANSETKNFPRPKDIANVSCHHYPHETSNHEQNPARLASEFSQQLNKPLDTFFSLLCQISSMFDGGPTTGSIERGHTFLFSQQSGCCYNCNKTCSSFRRLHVICHVKEASPWSNRASGFSIICYNAKRSTVEDMREEIVYVIP
jgi:hypothetical protein